MYASRAFLSSGSGGRLNKSIKISFLEHVANNFFFETSEIS